jgi:hypothetical protein
VQRSGIDQEGPSNGNAIGAFLMADVYSFTLFQANHNNANGIARGLFDASVNSDVSAC